MSLTNDEMARLILSVGKGGSGGNRFLTPVQAALLMERWLQSGATLADLSRQLKVSDSIIGRFLSLLKLTDTVKELVEFNASKTTLSFSIAHQISRIDDSNGQDELAKAALEYGLSSKSVEQVVQNVKRSGQSIDAAVKSILALKPAYERRHIIIGRVTSQSVRDAIANVRVQEKRDSWGKVALSRLIENIGSASFRITVDRFTVSGDDQMFAQISKLKPDFETAINAILTESLNDL